MIFLLRVSQMKKLRTMMEDLSLAYMKIQFVKKVGLLLRVHLKFLVRISVLITLLLTLI